MRVLAIDPGCTQSAFVVYDPEAREIHDHGICDNASMLASIEECHEWDFAPIRCVIEMVASFGMTVGREVFETVYWIGRFAERWNATVPHVSNMWDADRLVRRDVKMHLCGNNAAKDANIRAALLDMFGPGKTKAVGTKGAKGPLYGIRADEWQALALAVTYVETTMQNREAA